MSDAGYVHGSTDDAEVARLVRQAAFVATFSLVDFEASSGTRALDLGTGVGAMAAEIARRFPGIDLTAVDVSEAQLARARALHPIARYIVADAHALPFPDGSFDRVHASWVLEHVAEPSRVLREVRRVLGSGGVAHMTEVDNATLKLDPPLPELEATFAALNAAQLAAHGDPFIGRKLEHLAREAGFARASLRHVDLCGDDAHPEMRSHLHEEFAGICESLDEVLDDAGVALAREAARSLRARGPGTRFTYQPVVMRAYVDDPR